MLVLPNSAGTEVCGGDQVGDCEARHRRTRIRMSEGRVNLVHSDGGLKLQARQSVSGTPDPCTLCGLCPATPPTFDSGAGPPRRK